MNASTPCRACGAAGATPVLDLGDVPAADVFPSGGTRETDPRHSLAMVLCTACGLAQIAHDDTAPEQPMGIEPRALVEQAEAAIALAADRGWLAGTTVHEFPSPHGGTWLPMLRERGHRPTEGPAAVVLDSFGIMHEADQRAAWRARAAATAPDGVLLVQFHSLAAILRHGQWTSLRHGHAAYYSLTAVTRLLADVGMGAVGVETFDLYGGTVLVAARHGDHAPDERTNRVLADEARLRVTDPVAVASLQTRVESDVTGLRRWLEDRRDAGLRVHAYGAASVAVAQFGLAGLDRSLVAAVADASPAKQGRRMPGTDICIISPAELVDAAPDLVLLTLPDLLPELEKAYPALAGRWVVMGDRDSS